MASGPHWNAKRGTWSALYWDGHWRRVVIVRKRPGWAPGGRDPKKPPPEAVAEMAKYIALEKAAKARTKQTPVESLGAFLDAHVETYANPLSREGVRVVVDQFVAWCSGRKVTRLDQLTTDLCSAWVAEQSARHAAATVRRKRAQLAVAWRRRKKVANPWTDADVAGKPVIKKRGSWTPEQYRKLRKAARPWLKDLLAVGVHTGLRIAALMSLKWEDVHLEPGEGKGYGWVHVRPEIDKAKRGYRVPVSKDLHDLLFRRRTTSDSDFVLVGQNGRPIRNRDVTGQAIRRACRRAGLPKPDSPNHHLRRSFGRWAVMGHLTGTPVPLYVVSKWLGHSQIKTTLIYLDIEEDDSTRFMLGPGDQSGS